MDKNSIIDYSGFILLKFLGPLVRILPKGLSLKAGKLLGEIFYAFDLKHRALAYANIKTALGARLPPGKIRILTRNFYQAFGQNLFEIFLIPLIDKNYIKKYVTIHGLENVQEGFKRGRGIIFLAVHAGSWELSNIIAANLGFKFSMFVRQQKFPHLERLLNSYRSAKGCRLIKREEEVRELIRVIKANESIVLTLDQGGKTGRPVRFFHKDAAMASGAVRLALKYNTSLIPVFLRRKKGPYIEIFLGPDFELYRTGDLDKDIQDNLEALVRIFERYIKEYPPEYLWSYKVWKYSKTKNILILTDGKTGHLRQAQGLAKIITGYYEAKGITTYIRPVEVKFKNKFSRYALTLSNLLAGKFICQGCLFCLEKSLESATYNYLIRQKADIVISCSAPAAAANYLLARENLAKSLVIMRPGIFSSDRFDLVIQSQHDDPPKARNIVAIEGALNLIDQEYLKEQSERLTQATGLKREDDKVRLGILIGGNTKEFSLSDEYVKLMIDQIKLAAEKLDAQILITTSRRTPQAVEELLKRQFYGYYRCKLLVIANERNFPFSVGGILGLSQIIITSAESISMISEAASSQKYVVVFGYEGLKGRHKKFLDNFASQKYIYPSSADDLSQTLQRLWSLRPVIKTLKDNQLVLAAIKKVL